MVLKTFLKNKANRQKFRLNGLVPSGRLPKKRELCQKFRHHMLYSPEQLPPKVDLRSDMTPVENQSRIGSCAANCLAGAYEYLTKKANGRNTDVSRLFIYYNARVKDQKSQNVMDSGCTMTSAIEALEEFGTCLESLWPYDTSRVNTRPSEQSYKEAQRHKITEALRVNINLAEMKSCLAQGFPFAFGLRLYSSFDQAAKTGIVPMPNASENARQSHGSHALLAVGYSDQSKAFIVRNSWGEQWGDKGYCYIPYDYVTNPYYSFDVWTVRKLAVDNFGQNHWDNRDVVNYSRDRQLNGLQNDFDDNIRSIEAGDDSDDDDDNNKYNRRDNFDDRWNQFDVYRGYNNGRNNNFDDPWNQHQGNKHPRNNDYEQYRNPFEGYPGDRNFPHLPFDQYGGDENFFNFQYINNGPDFFNNPFNQPPAFPIHQRYGQDYGYGSPFNNHFNPFF